MFVFTLKKEIVVRIMLIAVILFNALASNAQPVQAKQEAGSTIGSRLNGMEQKSFSKQHLTDRKRESPNKMEVRPTHLRQH